MSNLSLIRDALHQGDGIVRLAPCWVPRPFNMPGKRLKLHPHDLYAFGAQRGGIDERWLASVTKADNGPGTVQDEGLSYIEHQGHRVLLSEAMDELGDEFLGEVAMRLEKGWNVLAKFFDNYGPIAHHMHQGEEHARRVGRKPKPEAYYFPRQLNLVEHSFPYSFLGLIPGATRGAIRRCLEHWNCGDNGILDHSPAYRLQPGTGWQIDTGILHAPGTLVTYEVQGASDVGAVFQSLVNGRAMPWEALVKDVPQANQHDLDYILEMLDWEANADPSFVHKRMFHPVLASESEEYSEKWIVYSTPFYSAKELTVHPGHAVTIADAAAYGLVVMEGYGTVGTLDVETPTVIRFGQMTQDELFVSFEAAKQGVRVTNHSRRENLVLLKHFGPGNPEAVRFIQ